MAHAIPAGAPPRAARLPALSDHRAARFATIIVLYFLQGVPLGLSLVALPAWLAQAGASPLEIGAFVGIAGLPWSTKLFNGLVMDRYAYKPMGRRRGWILLSQAAMVAALIVMAIAAPGASDIALLSGLCFALNLCATFSDVAVDGMAVDIVPETERTAINSVMFASQTAGVAACSFLAGQTLASGGTASAALIIWLATDRLYDNFYAIVAFFGAIFAASVGVLLADGWVLRRSEADLASLHDTSGGPYVFWLGINPVALIALAAGFVTYIAVLDPVSQTPGALFRYTSASLPAIAAGFVVHLAFSRWVTIPLGLGGYPALARAKTVRVGAEPAE